MTYRMFVNFRWSWLSWIVGVGYAKDYFATDGDNAGNEDDAAILAFQVIDAGWSEYTQICRRHMICLYIPFMVLLVTLIGPGVPACEFIVDDDEGEECEV